MSPLLWPTQIAHRKTQKKTKKTNCNYHGKSAREAGQLLFRSSFPSSSSLGATTEASSSTSCSSWHSPDFAEHIVGVSPLRVTITFAYLHATASRLQIVANASELSMNGRPTRSVVSRLAKDCWECASVCVCCWLSIKMHRCITLPTHPQCDCVCTPSCLSKLAFNDVDARSASGNIAAYNYGHSNNNNA